MKMAVQMLSMQYGSRSDVMVWEPSEFVGFLIEKTPRNCLDIHYVLVIFEDVDPALKDWPVSKHPVISVRQFVHQYGSEEDGRKLLSTAVGNDGSAALQSGPERGN